MSSRLIHCCDLTPPIKLPPFFLSPLEKFISSKVFLLCKINFISKHALKKMPKAEKIGRRDVHLKSVLKEE